MHNMKKLILSVFIFTFGFAAATHAQQVNTVFTKKIPEAPGKEIEVITVNYPPGAVDTIHRHDAHVVVYVLEGEVEMQVRGGTLQRLGPGQGFYESPEDVHTVRRNQRSSSYFLSKMKEHRFSLPLTSFGALNFFDETILHKIKQHSLRGGRYEFKSRATQRERDRDCPSVRTVCARSFLSIRCS